MAADAPHVLDPHQVLVASPGQARNLRRLGHLHHRVPVGGGIHLGRGGRIGSDEHGEIEVATGDGAYLGRVGEPVAAHPHAVVRLGQIGDEVAPLVVGDDDLREAGCEVVGLGDDPHAGFRPKGGLDDASDLFSPYLQRCRPCLRHCGRQSEKTGHEQVAEGSGTRSRRAPRFSRCAQITCVVHVDSSIDER